jgi:hypothetical protein
MDMQRSGLRMRPMNGLAEVNGDRGAGLMNAH